MVHGLARTPVSFAGLGRTLRREGCATATFPYAAFAQRVESIVARLAVSLDRQAREGELTVVGHSLGGLLLRAALPRMHERVPRHLVMLGTPNQPPRAARLAVGVPPFRWIAGECGSCLASPAFYETLPEPIVPYTLIAGTRGLGGRWSPFGGEPNDGLVAVSETRIRADDVVLTFPVSHTFMMNDRRVQGAICAALGIHSAVTQITSPGPAAR
jgi:hypothetical protein